MPRKRWAFCKPEIVLSHFSVCVPVLRQNGETGGGVLNRKKECDTEVWAEREEGGSD